MVKHTQTIRRQQPTSCLSLFDYFVGLALERLTVYSFCKKLHLRYLVLNRPLYQIDSNIKWCDSKRMVQRGWLYKKFYKLKKKKKRRFWYRCHNRASAQKSLFTKKIWLSGQNLPIICHAKECAFFNEKGIH